MHLNGKSFQNHLHGDFWILFIFTPTKGKEPSTVLLTRKFKNAKKRTLVFTQLFVGGSRGIYFLRKSITYERAFLHSSKYMVQPIQLMHNCLFFALRAHNWVSINWGRRTYWMRRQRVATDSRIGSSAFYPIKWWGKWFDCVGNAFCLG